MLVVGRLGGSHDDRVGRSCWVVLLGTHLHCWPSNRNALDWRKCDVIALESFVRGLCCTRPMIVWLFVVKVHYKRATDIDGWYLTNPDIVLQFWLPFLEWCSEVLGHIDSQVFVQECCEIIFFHVLFWLFFFYAWEVSACREVCVLRSPQGVTIL